MNVAAANNANPGAAATATTNTSTVNPTAAPAENGGLGANFKDSNANPGTAANAGVDLSDFHKSLPAEYQKSPMFKDMADIAALAKGYANSQTLIGQKALVRPGADAAPEAIAAWNKFVGVPENVEGYGLEGFKIEGMETDAKATEYFTTINKEFGDLALKLGIPTEAAKGLAQWYQGKLAEAWPAAQQQAQINKEEQDADFANMVAAGFGENGEKAVKNGNALMAQFAPDQASKDAIASLDNKQLFAVLQVLNGIAGKYISEDKIPLNNTTLNTTGQSKEAIRSEAQTMMAQRLELMKDPIRNKTQIDDLTKKINASYAKV